MIFIKCQDGMYINAETIKVFYVQDEYNRASTVDPSIIAVSPSNRYFLGRYPIEQIDDVLEQLIGHLTTNRNYDMPEANEEVIQKCILTTV